MDSVLAHILALELEARGAPSVTMATTMLTVGSVRQYGSTAVRH